MAETDTARFKQVNGDGLRSHTDERQATEVDFAAHVLNRMLELGRPNSIRTAWTSIGAGVNASTSPTNAATPTPAEAHAAISEVRSRIAA